MISGKSGNRPLLRVFSDEKSSCFHCKSLTVLRISVFSPKFIKELCRRKICRTVRLNTLLNGSALFMAERDSESVPPSKFTVPLENKRVWFGFPVCCGRPHSRLGVSSRLESLRVP